jgi:hypothetical protein
MHACCAHGTHQRQGDQSARVCQRRQVAADEDEHVVWEHVQGGGQGLLLLGNWIAASARHAVGT